MTTIRHIACASDGDLFATAAFERTVSIWSFRARRLVATFETILDFGGRRLAVVPGENPVAVAGAYYIHGMAGYDLHSGKLLWQRKDLKKVQTIHVAGDSRALLVGFEGRRFRRIHPRTGADQSGPSGVKAAYGGPSPGQEIHVLRGASIALWDGTISGYRWRSSGEGFGILTVAVSPFALLASEAAGPLRCLRCDGSESWKWIFEAGTHAVDVAWNRSAGVWVSVVSNYELGGGRKLVRFSSTGTQVANLGMGSHHETAFFTDGSHQ